MGESTPLVNDSTIENAYLITAKPFASRLDVYPFIILYCFAISAYMSFQEEWQQVLAMISIPVIIFFHSVVILIGYWYIPFRLTIAYTIHQTEDVISHFRTFNAKVFLAGLTLVKDQYESQLTRYKVWYTWHQHMIKLRRKQHQQLILNHQKNPTVVPPPAPLELPAAPVAPVIGRPIVLYNNLPLEICIIPSKNYGSPLLTSLTYDIGDNTRIQYQIDNLPTPNDVILSLSTQSSINISFHNIKTRLIGPHFFPPLTFSHHYTKYIIDPNNPLLVSSLSPTSLASKCIENTSQFVLQRFPDYFSLRSYLTHQLTPTILPQQIWKYDQTTTTNTNNNNIDANTNQEEEDLNINPTHPLFPILSLPSLLQSNVTYELLWYGMNSRTVPIPGFISLFLENAMSPFFVFQVMCILLWCLDEYWYYSIFTLVMIVGLECHVVYKRRSHLNHMLGEKPPLPHVYVYRLDEQHITTTSSSIDTNTKNTKNENFVDTSKNNIPGHWEFSPSQCLVPGDIVALPLFNDSKQISTVFGPQNEQWKNTQGTFASGRPVLYSYDVPCDLLLLNGSCVCDESMLTGESVPQIKEDLLSLKTASIVASSNNTVSENMYNDTNNNNNNNINNEDNIIIKDELEEKLDTSFHKRHELYAGTKLIGIQRTCDLTLFDTSCENNNNNNNSNEFLQISNLPPLGDNTDYVLCRVIRTGFSTLQGGLVRTILTATSQNLIDREALLFILCLLCCALVSAYFVLIEGLSDPNRSRYKLLLNVITIITSVVPPELPMELNMAVTNALTTLAKTQVFCTEPNRIPFAGQIDVCCFDKTGTLTSDHFLLSYLRIPQLLSYNKDNNSSNSSDIDQDMVNNEKNKKYQKYQKDGKDNTNDANDTNNVENSYYSSDYITIHASGDIITTLNDDDNEKNNNNNTKQSTALISTTCDTNEQQSLDCSHLPIDMRLALSCAQELTMLRSYKKPSESESSSSSSSNDTNNKQSERIIGDPMETVAFQQAGFHFHQKSSDKNSSSSSSSSSSDHSSTRVYCHAAPVVYNKTLIEYSIPKLLLQLKTRLDVLILHRFTFHSQLQRMSSIILVNDKNVRFTDAKYQSLDTGISSSSSSSSSSLSSSNDTISWLSDTLPTPELRTIAKQTCLRVVVKGSPECIYNLLDPDFRPNFEEYSKQHQDLARQGLRVLAYAWKPLYYIPLSNTICDINYNITTTTTTKPTGTSSPQPLVDSSGYFTSSNNNNTITNSTKKKSSLNTSNNINSSPSSQFVIPHREICESKLFFTGFIGFSSPLKTQSASVIEHLQSSCHRTVIVTGDHLLTAIAVAKSLKIAHTNCWQLSIKQQTSTKSSSSTSLTNAINTDELQWIDEYEQPVHPFTPNDPLFIALYNFISSRGTNTSNTLTTLTPYQKANKYYIIDTQRTTSDVSLLVSNTTSKYIDLSTLSLCIGGKSLSVIMNIYEDILPLLCSITTVFARTLPMQKELIMKNIRSYKNQVVLMCGDGTNDVGALTHANIGIALFSIDTDATEHVEAQNKKLIAMEKHMPVKKLLDMAQRWRDQGFLAQAEECERNAHDTFRRIVSFQTQLTGSTEIDQDEEEEEDAVAKLGDASLAAAFSAKHGSIRCVVDVIRQGRCALATTGQMYQILALQCLSAAYSLSALYFRGVRQSEGQMTVSGLVGTAMSMLLSRSQPLQQISAQRPNSKIFSKYNITTILLQFIIHLTTLVSCVSYAMQYTSPESLVVDADDFITKTVSTSSNVTQNIVETITNNTTIIDGEEIIQDAAQYLPSVLNSTVFLLTTAMSATTILANYVGYPYMTPLTQTTLFRVIIGTLLGCIAISLETFPEINELLQIDPMPTEDYGFYIASAIFIDCFGCVIVALGCKLFFGIVTFEQLTKPLPKHVMATVSLTKQQQQQQQQQQSLASKKKITHEQFSKQVVVSETPADDTVVKNTTVSKRRR